MLTALEPWQWKSAIRDNLMDRRDPRPLRWKDPKIEFRGRTTPLSAAVRTLIREEGKGLALYLAIPWEDEYVAPDMEDLRSMTYVGLHQWVQDNLHDPDTLTDVLWAALS